VRPPVELLVCLLLVEGQAECREMLLVKVLLEAFSVLYNGWGRRLRWHVLRR
jgi:hypothetical protein